MDGADMTIETKLGGTVTQFSMRKIEPTSFSIGFSHSFNTSVLSRTFVLVTCLEIKTLE